MDIAALSSPQLYLLEYIVLANYPPSSEYPILRMILIRNKSLRLLSLQRHYRNEYIFENYGFVTDSTGFHHLQLEDGDSLPPLEELKLNVPYGGEYNFTPGHIRKLTRSLDCSHLRVLNLAHEIPTNLFHHLHWSRS